ncbi:MAG: PAS domain-containing protein [Planctomycetes bacterium]|nr:PAS domain-containing protein [Planctomycetota bacterium]
MASRVSSRILPREPGAGGLLTWLPLLRLAVAGLAAYVVFRQDPKHPFQRPEFLLLVGASVINLPYLLLQTMTRDRRKLVMAQLAIDILTISGLVYMAGPLSPHAYFYFAVVILVALFISPRAGLGFAAFSSAFLVLITSLYFTAAHFAGIELPYLASLASDEIVPLYGMPELMLFSLLLYVAGLHAVAWLAGRLSEELNRVRILNTEILQNMTGGVIAVDLQGAIAFVNPQAASLLQISEPSARVAGRSYAEALPSEISDLFQRSLARNEHVEQEVRIGSIPIGISLSPLSDERNVGRIRGVVAILNDLTLRHEMERMAKRAERFRALLEISASIAHEIRNPIASIRGAAQELSAVPVSGEDNHALLNIVIRESDRLDKIVSDFLDYAGDRPEELKLLNVADLLQEVVLLLQTRAGAGRVQIRLETPREATCRGAHDKLKQVFLNLGLNALEAGGEKGGTLAVRCFHAHSPKGDLREGVLVEFEDNGPGIAPEHLARLFTPFFTTKPRGTGMGLAIARKIVEDHDGSIVMDSRVGKGTVARVWLPSI